MQNQQIIILFLSFTGLRQTVTGSTIINGAEVPDDAMQYMASVQNNYGHVCGGFLVSDNFVLTAAHCYQYHLTHVVLGSHNLQNTKNGQIIDICEKFIHPCYKDVGQGDDLMLLKLKTNAVLENGVKILQLPSKTMSITHNSCQVAGWGKTKTTGGNNNKLMVTNVSIIDKTTCIKAWNHLPHNVICAGGGTTGRGFCQGDSGGPLVCENTAVGTVSFNRNYNCHYQDEVPNVFVDISKYLHWILSTISSK